jgi:hypothetical protein
VGRVAARVERARRSGSFRNVTDAGTVLGLPFTLIAVLKLLSEWAPGPFSFLADLNVWWYVLAVGVGLLGGSYVVTKRTPPPITGVAPSDHDALTKRVAELEAQIKAGPPAEVVQISDTDGTRAHDDTPKIEEPVWADGTDREQERAALGLRPLGPLEIGLDSDKAPNGTFYFQPLSHAGEWKAPYGLPIVAEAERVQWPVELHRMHDGEVFLVGYVSESAAALLADPTSKFPLEVFPRPWADRVKRVRVSARRAGKTEDRKFKYGYMLDIQIVPAGTAPRTVL